MEKSGKMTKHTHYILSSATEKKNNKSTLNMHLYAYA